MFGGFKASLKILGSGIGKKNKNYELSPDINVPGAYRASRDDPYGSNANPQATKNGTRTLEDAIPHLRPAKSTPNISIAQPRPVIPNLRNSTHEISSDPRGAETDRNRNSTNLAKEKANKKIEKQRADEEKARQKQIAQESAKEEKLKKEQEKKDAKLAKEMAKRRSKQPAPQPATQPALQPAPQPPPQRPQRSSQQPAPQRPQRAHQTKDNSNPTAQRPYSTNTLESSISRSTGPPPYAEDPDELNKDSTGNVIYRKPKPKDEGSWDMISQHRQQIARPNTSANVSKQNKQMVMDLNYNFEQRVDKENSDA